MTSIGGVFYSHETFISINFDLQRKLVKRISLVLATWWLSCVKQKATRTLTFWRCVCPLYNLVTPVDDTILLSGSNQTEFNVGPKSHSEGSSHLHASDSLSCMQAAKESFGAES